MNNKKKYKRVEFEVNGDQIVKKIKEIIEKGNARRVIIKNEAGKEIASFPLTVGVAGGVLGLAISPVLVAAGAIAGLVTKCTLVVEEIDA